MNCPNCKNQVEIPELWEFFDCPHCLASLELAQGVLKLLKPVEEKHTSLTAKNLKPPSASELQPEEPAPIQDFQHSLEREEHSPPPPQDLSAQIDDQPALEEEEPAAAEPEHPEEPAKEDCVTEQTLEEAKENTSQNAQELSFSAHTPPPPAKSPEDLSSIADFGNAPRQNQNLFSYELKISGIDSEELLLQVQRVLSFPRLKISKNTALSSGGCLILKELHAVQAMYLVKQFIHLPVTVSWSQKSKLS